MLHGAVKVLNGVFADHTCASSVQLQTWCAQNKNRCYIPEWLLKVWRIEVDPDLSGAA
jgi:hypothetical protein